MTLKELSEATGISIATISRILNGQTNGNSDKLRRLEMAIEGSNDQKLLSRFRSISEKRKVIAVVIPDITNPFFTDVLKGVRGILHKHDYELIIMDSEENVDEEINILNTLKTLNLSGVIITPVSDADEECQSENILKDLRIPVVLVDRDVRSSSIDGVFVNNELGAYDGVMELIHNGHRNIGLIAGPTSSKPGRERLNGYVTALNEAGIAVDPDLIMPGDFSRKSGFELANRLLDAHPEITAIFSSNNLMTIGVLQALAQRDDGRSGIEVIGFDEVSDLLDHDPGITVIQRPTKEMGETAAKIILERLDSKGRWTNRRITLTPSLLRAR